MDDLENLLISGDFHGLVKAFKLLPQANYLKSELTILESKLKSIEKQRTFGTISSNDLEIRENKLRESFLKLIEKVNKENTETPPVELSDKSKIPVIRIIKNDHSSIRKLFSYLKRDNPKEIKFILFLSGVSKYYEIISPLNITIKELSHLLAKEIYPNLKIQEFNWEISLNGKELAGDLSLEVSGLSEHTVIEISREYRDLKKVLSPHAIRALEKMDMTKVKGGKKNKKRWKGNSGGIIPQ